VFFTQKDVPNVPPANPRQITGFGFALKTPTKLKIHLNPTIFNKLHPTFLT
jgi:hypothetical protein